MLTLVMFVQSASDGSTGIPKRPHSPGGHHGTPPKRSKEEEDAAEAEVSIKGCPLSSDG